VDADRTTESRAEVDAIHEQIDRLNRRPPPASLDDFHAYMPMHRYLYVPTRDLWPASSVNARVQPWPVGSNGKAMPPTDWIDQNRPIEQLVWHPDYPEVIADRLVDAGGWVSHRGARAFNLFRRSKATLGDPAQVGRWLDHLRLIYPFEADHIEAWLAHRIQRPGEKVNHALVLGGAQGIGKDTLLEPVKAGVGPWNWQDISPTQMMGRFNGWVKAVVVRVSEARDLGDVDRFAFYDHSKVYIAAPPDVIRVDEKHLREQAVFNVMGVIVTTNHKSDGIFLPPDDRRHFVAWSEATKEDFGPAYWTALWKWYEAGGIAHVVAHLAAFDLSGFDPKAPPPKTEAFWAIAQASQDPEAGELHDVIEKAGRPDALTKDTLIGNAEALQLYDLVAFLRDRRNARQIPHKLERAGYVSVRNPDAESGLWVVDGKRQVVYASAALTVADRLRAARARCRAAR
jgi:hypothetical protein